MQATEQASDSDVANGSVQLLAALQPRGRVISALEFAPPLTRPHIAHQLATTFPALRQLTLSLLRTPLPPSKFMPHLTDLDILWATEEPAVASTVWHSVAQYLPQLIRLALLHIDDKLYRASWDDQFSPTLPPALSLTHFETSQALGDGLLGFLLSHVPNLAYLRAGSVCARKAVHSGKQWGLREFHSDDLRGYDMSKLPRPKNGPVRVSNFWLDLSLDVGVEVSASVWHLHSAEPYTTRTRLCACVCGCQYDEWLARMPHLPCSLLCIYCSQGLPARDVWALSDCVLVPHPSNPSRHPRILLNPSSTLEDSIEAQPQALATAIRQLACMQQQPNVVCYISDWEWSAELCAAVGEAMADVPQLQLGFRSSNHVTDEVGSDCCLEHCRMHIAYCHTCAQSDTVT